MNSPFAGYLAAAAVRLCSLLTAGVICAACGGSQEQSPPAGEQPSLRPQLLAASSTFGTVQVLASARWTPRKVVVAGGKAIFSDSPAGNASASEIMSVPIDGGAVSQLGNCGSSGIASDMAVNSASVVWAVNPGGGQGAICLASLGGSATTTLPLAFANQPAAIAIDSSNVYWAENNAGSVAIRKVPLVGGDTTNLVSGPTNVLHLSNGRLYWFQFGASADQGGVIMNLDLATNTVSSVLALAPGSAPVAFASDAQHLFWSETSGNIRQVPLSGGPVTTVVSGVSATGIYLFGNTLYWVQTAAAFGGGSIRRVTVSTGAVETVAENLTSPFSVFVDQSGVYWTDVGTDGTDGSVNRVALNGQTQSCPNAPRHLLADNVAADGIYEGVLSDVSVTPGQATTAILTLNPSALAVIPPQLHVPVVSDQPFPVVAHATYPSAAMLPVNFAAKSDVVWGKIESPKYAVSFCEPGQFDIALDPYDRQGLLLNLLNVLFYLPLPSSEAIAVLETAADLYANVPLIKAAVGELQLAFAPTTSANAELRALGRAGQDLLQLYQGLSLLNVPAAAGLNQKQQALRAQALELIRILGFAAADTAADLVTSPLKTTYLGAELSVFGIQAGSQRPVVTVRAQ